ncbi:MAG: NADH-quinone oxidoreductase subunit J [Pyrinomonadaceae bacterium]
MDTITLYIPMMLFLLFGAVGIGCAISVVAQRNPLYSAVSLIGVFLSFAGLYILLAAPFIAAVQIIVYAGAIMVLVVFVIMLLNIEEEEHRPVHLRMLIPTAVLLAMVLIGEAAFIFYFIGDTGARLPNSTVGNTASIGSALFTKYLLPFEITSVLLLMALVGAITLARRVGETTASADDIDASEFAETSNVISIADATAAHK